MPCNTVINLDVAKVKKFNAKSFDIFLFAQNKACGFMLALALLKVVVTSTVDVKTLQAFYICSWVPVVWFRKLLRAVTDS